MTSSEDRRCEMDGMRITMTTPHGKGLHSAIDALAGWQHDGLPIQLHSGDLGWAYQIGASALSERVRMWDVNGEIRAVGYLDDPTVLRVAIASEAGHDEELAVHMVNDIVDPSHGVLPEGSVSVEARFGAAFHSRLRAAGWQPDELWTPLIRDLTEPVEDSGVRIEEVGPDQVQARVSVQRASFEASRFTEERWQAMADGPAYANARCRGQVCSSRWACTAITEGMAMAEQSPLPLRLRFEEWAPRARWCAQKARTSALSLPTRPPASNRHRRSPTFAAPAS